MTVSAHNRDRILELRAQGLTRQEISTQTGLSKSTVSMAITDPDGSKERARRSRYGGVCQACGAATDGSYGRARAPQYCCHCAPRQRPKVWTHDRVITAIQAWHGIHGEPPCAGDWSPWLFRDPVTRQAAFQEFRDGGWPNVRVVQKLFGSWAAAIRAAGLEPVGTSAPRKARRQRRQKTTA